jgi:hypothetical protein
MFIFALRTNPMTQSPVFAAISIARVVVAPREITTGIFATRHLRTISEEIRPEQIA